MAEFSSFILIGGKSERFGSPKWRMKFHGKPVLDGLIDLCKYFHQSSTIVSKKGMENPQAQSIIYDRYSFHAPIAGIATALSHTKSQWNLILSCDLPLIRPLVVRRLMESVEEDYDIVIPHSGNGFEPLCALYDKSVLPVIENLIEKEEFALFKLLEKLKTKIVECRDLKEQFTNVNRVEDLAGIRD